MTAPSKAQIRADFHEIGQLLTCCFKSKKWIKLIDGIVTIDYISNLNTSHNILLTVSSSSASYSFLLMAPFEIKQKDKHHQSQYMLKAKDLSKNESVLLTIIFKTVSIANKFYNLIIKGGPSSSLNKDKVKIIRRGNIIKHNINNNNNNNNINHLKRISIITSTTDNTDHDDDEYDDNDDNDEHKISIDRKISNSNSYSNSIDNISMIAHYENDINDIDNNNNNRKYRWECKRCTLNNDKYKMSCIVCKSFNELNWVCIYCRFHNCAFRKVCMVCNVPKNPKMINRHNLQQWTLNDIINPNIPYCLNNSNSNSNSKNHDFRHFIKQQIKINNDIYINHNNNLEINEEKEEKEVQEEKSEEYTSEEYLKWKDDMKWIISIIIREHGLKARKKLYKLEIITKNLMKMEPKYRRFPQSKRTHSLLNGIKQFIEWIGFQTCQNSRHHSQKFILLNTPPKWQLIKTAKLLKSYRDKLTLPCKIPRNGNKKNKNNKSNKDNKQNIPNHKKWIKEFEDLCDENEILQLMVDQAIIYETHPYNSIFTNNIDIDDNKNDNNNDNENENDNNNINELDEDEDENENELNINNDDILSSNKSHKHNKAMSIKTVISFIDIFLDGINVLNKLLLKYKELNKVNNNIGRYCSVKNNKLMSMEETKLIYKAIQQYIIDDILKYWINEYWEFHFISNDKATKLLIYLYQFIMDNNNYLQVQHRKDLIQIIEYKYKYFNNNNNNNNDLSFRLNINNNEYDIESTIEWLINTDLQKFVIQKSIIDNELFQSTNFHEWILWGIASPSTFNNCIYNECYKFRNKKCKNIIKLFNEYDLFIRWIQFIIFSAYKRHLNLLANGHKKSQHINAYFQFASLIQIFIEIGINFDKLHNYHSLSAVYYALNTNPIKSIIESQKEFIMNALCQCQDCDNDNYKYHDISVCFGKNCDQQFEIIRKRWDLEIFDPNALYSNFRQSQKSLWKASNINQQNTPYFVPYFTLIFASIVEYYEHYLYSQWNYIKQLNLIKYNKNIHMLQYLKYSLLNQNYILENNKNNNQILMKLSKYKSSSEQCLRLMINLHCKITRLFDRCGNKARHKYAISDISNSEEENEGDDLYRFLQTQFQQMLNV